MLCYELNSAKLFLIIFKHNNFYFRLFMTDSKPTIIKDSYSRLAIHLFRSQTLHRIGQRRFYRLEAHC